SPGAGDVPRDGLDLSRLLLSTLGQRLSPIDAVGATHEEECPIGTSESATHRGFLLRLRDHAAHTTRRVEHLDADIARDVEAALNVDRHTVAAASLRSDGGSELDVSFAAAKAPVRGEKEGPAVDTPMFAHDQERLVRAEGDAIGTM